MSVKLLIADDEESIRNGIRNYVRLHTDRIEQIYLAQNGQQALDAIIQYRPQIMLLDIQMPVMNGIEVMKEAAKAGILPRTIILSGYDDFKYAQQAIRYGVEEYVLKPCRSTEVMQLLNKLLDEILGEEQKEPVREVSGNMIVNQAVEYMREHYNEELTLVDVAEKVGISGGYLSTLFTQNLDAGFVETLNKIRIERACVYLEQNQMKTYEVAFKVGFRDEKYFSRIFKKVIGKTPSEYKKRDR
ncbi:MAG: response regulator [Lachnospiraceae bacterium]|nr:response regulator [Lachnospiraceae bacterium]